MLWGKIFVKSISRNFSWKWFWAQAPIRHGKNVFLIKNGQEIHTDDTYSCWWVGNLKSIQEKLNSRFFFCIFPQFYIIYMAYGKKKLGKKWRKYIGWKNVFHKISWNIILEYFKQHFEKIKVIFYDYFLCVPIWINFGGFFFRIVSLITSLFTSDTEKIIRFTCKFKFCWIHW